METLFNTQEYDKNYQKQQQFETLLKNWCLHEGDCWQGNGDYWFILNGEMFVDIEDIIYINKHKIPFAVYVRYWDFIMNGGKFKNKKGIINFEYWFNNTK